MNEFDLQKLVDVLTKQKQTSSQSGSSTGGWIAGLVTLVLFLIVVAIFAFQAWKSGKETARLLHEAAVRDEAARTARVDAQLAENASTAVELLEKVDSLEEESELLREQASVEAERHTKALEQINSIASWDDVDSLLRKN